MAITLILWRNAHKFLECNPRPVHSGSERMNPAGHSIKNVAAVVGSLRRGSLNRKFAESVVGKLSADRLRFHFIEIADLPLLPEAFTAICLLRRAGRTC